MRDALRAVGVVIGVPLLLAGGFGLARGAAGTAEIAAAAMGAACLVLVAITPPGKPPPPLYDDDW